MHLSAIVAFAENRVIGIQNKLPWHLPADLRHFKQITTGKTILMGRKTYESIGRPLPNRRNIIISRDPLFNPTGCEVFHSLEEIFSHFKNEDELVLIGGAQLYQDCLPKVTKLYLTMVHASVEGDAFFPEINFSEWQEISREKHEADANNAFAYSFITLVRKTN